MGHVCPAMNLSSRSGSVSRDRFLPGFHCGYTRVMTVINSLDDQIAAKRMLDHPFYQRWSAGTLSPEELREYARQYYHYALAFPTFLSAMHAQCDDLATRQAILENLIEEERGADNHPELWLRFCEALGLDRGD